MEAVVLAGGFGTRLKHVVSDVPKPMAPVCGKPFLKYILDDLIEKGVRRIVLAVGYKAEVIENHFGKRYRGAELVYSMEDTPLFTGGAIKKALECCTQERVVIVNGDTYFDVDLAGMMDFAEQKDASLVIATRRMENFDRYGVIQSEEGRICAFLEKAPRKEGDINGGIYMIRRGLLADAPVKFSFETDFMEKKLHEVDMWTYASGGYFIDIGIPEDYARAQADFIAKAAPNKAAFFDRDGTINIDVGYLHDTKDLRFIEGMPEFIRRFNDCGYKVIVVTNQAGIARGYYTEAEMHALHDEMNRQLAEKGAHIDAFYFCPHHPDITGPCACRKPEAGMFEQAIREFDVDVAASVMFGDKIWDIEAAAKVGVKGYIMEDQNGKNRKA